MYKYRVHHAHMHHHLEKIGSETPTNAHVLATNTHSTTTTTKYTSDPESAYAIHAVCVSLTDKCICVCMYVCIFVCTFLREIKTAEKSRGDIFSVYLHSLSICTVDFF